MEPSTYKLDTFADREKLSEISNLSHFYYQFYIPTEIVVFDAAFFTPPVGRVYHTNYSAKDGIMYLRNDVIDVLKESGETLSDAGYCDVLLIEYYENYGDDGHTEYGIGGFILMTKNAYDNILNKVSYIVDKPKQWTEYNKSLIDYINISNTNNAS